jgi:hypothetical protein
MATSWSNFNNGDTGLAIRNKLNTFNTGVATDISNAETAISNNTSDISALDTRVDATETSVANAELRLTTLEANHVKLIDGHSTATSQEPSTTDSPIQIEFGALQEVTEVSLAADGTVTFLEAGSYIVNISVQYGRTGSVGTSKLFLRSLLNGTPTGEVVAVEVTSSDILVPCTRTCMITVGVNDTFYIELLRDSTGDNSGGLLQRTPTLAAWSSNAAPSARMCIYKVG